MADPITPPATPPPEPPKTHPFADNLAKSLGMTVEEPKIEPVVLEGPPTHQRSLAEIVADNQDKAKETPVSPAPTAEPPKEPVKEAPKDPPPKIEVKRPQADELRQQLESLKNQPAPVAPPPASPAAPAPAAEDDYIKSLTDEQKDEIEIAKYAETKGQAGLSQKLVGFFKEFDSWVLANPDASPADIEEYTRTHRPAIQNRRKVEREWVADTTKAKLEGQLSERTQELERRQRALEIKPKIENIVQSFTELLTDPKQLALPDDIIPIDREVAECIQKEGYAVAVQKFPIEAPIVNQSINAVRDYLDIVHSVKPFKPQYDANGNPTNMHGWISQFIAKQEIELMNGPEDRQVNSKKQKFLPADQYTKLLQEKPNEAGKYWTFGDDYVIDMLAANANISASARLKELENAGFKRERASKTASPPTPPAPIKVENTPSTPPSPKAGTSSIPNSQGHVPPVSPNASFLDKLVPGASARI